jgi:hypothetical protein
MKKLLPCDQPNDDPSESCHNDVAREHKQQKRHHLAHFEPFVPNWDNFRAMWTISSQKISLLKND